MTTNFNTWLRELSAAGKGGADLAGSFPAAVRGMAWAMPIELPGDWTGATLTGAIRAAPDAATALATFTVSAMTYDAGAVTSTWTVSLAAGTGANSTGVLPVDADADGVEFFPCAFLLTPSGGVEELLFGAAFPVLGKV